MDDNDRNATATKGGVEDAVNKAKDEIIEIIRDSETKLLSAFYGNAKSTDKRILEGEVIDATLRARMAILETRMTDVEERLNLPPHQ